MTDAVRRRVGITQRQVLLPERGEVRDVLDVRLPRLLWALGFEPLPLPTLDDRAEVYLEGVRLDAVVLSGGDDVGVTPDRDAFEAVVMDHAVRRDLPLVGICRGLQQLVLRAGGTLDAVAGHAGTRHGLTGPWARGRRDVNSFHRLGVGADGLGELVPMATAPDGTVEAAVHPTLPWSGVMWHPEREPDPDPEDVALLRRLLTVGPDRTAP
jgi:gamma-glutamyl-gamma-aminobutyrate hydrolase PuuD